MLDDKIWQMGAAINIAGYELACNIASLGHIGEIGAAGLTQTELKNELNNAGRFFYKNGKTGKLYVNLMAVAKNYNELVDIVSDYHFVDGIVMAAGFSRYLFNNYKKEVVPKLGGVDQKRIEFFKKHGVATVILENPRCGGHINYQVDDSIGVSDLIKQWREFDKDANLVSSGGINKDNCRELLCLGNSLPCAEKGKLIVGNGLFFYITKQSKASFGWIKEQITSNKEVVLFRSSVKGLIGRAILNDYIKNNFRLENGIYVMSNEKERMTDESVCANCMDNNICTKEYCIFKKLRNSSQGFVDDGIIFTSLNYFEISKFLQDLLNRGKIKTLDIKSKDDLPDAKDVLEYLVDEYKLNQSK